MAVVPCPCAFRLRRLAQNNVPGIGVRDFSCKFPHKMTLVKCLCAFRPRRRLQNETSLAEILPSDLFEGASTEILLRDLSWRSSSETLPRDTLQRSCQQSSCRDLVHRSSVEISSRHLVQLASQGSCAAASTENFFYRDIRTLSLQNLTWYFAATDDCRSFPPFRLDSYMHTVYPMLLECALLGCCCTSSLAGLRLI